MGEGQILRLVAEGYEEGYRAGCNGCLVVLKGSRDKFTPTDRVYRVLQILVEEIEKLATEEGESR